MLVFLLSLYVGTVAIVVKSRNAYEKKYNQNSGDGWERLLVYVWPVLVVLAFVEQWRLWLVKRKLRRTLGKFFGPEKAAKVQKLIDGLDEL